jgi:isopentenyl-diphosphate delta-isomerase
MDRDGTENGARIRARKAEHLRVAVERDVDSRTAPGWEDVRLVHRALPEVDLPEIDLGVDFLGRHLALPLCISGMTGGHPAAREVNARLARAAQRFGLAMGVGSQRAALVDPALASTYEVARQVAPEALLFANIGAPQLIAQGPAPPVRPDQVRALIDSIAADALAVHLNFVQETVQAEGDRRARGCLAAIAELVATLPVPVLAKETGSGLDAISAARLAQAGVAALDVGGLGGTSFAAVEAQRAAAVGDRRRAQLGELYRDWGIPTAVALVLAAPTGLPLIATGGIRSGLDAARALALGATLVGVARPLLACAVQGDEAVAAWIEQFAAELRAALFLTGSQSLPELRQQPTVVLGETRRWLDQLGAQGDWSAGSLPTGHPANPLPTGRVDGGG